MLEFSKKTMRSWPLTKLPKNRINDVISTALYLFVCTFDNTFHFVFVYLSIMKKIFLSKYMV